MITLRTPRTQLLYVPKAYVAHTQSTLASLRQNWDKEEHICIYLHQICGLHQRNQCLFGQDCKSVHICRELWRSFLDNHAWLQSAVVRQPHLDSRDGKGGKGNPKLLEMALKKKAEQDARMALYDERVANYPRPGSKARKGRNLSRKFKGESEPDVLSPRTPRPAMNGTDAL